MANPQPQTTAPLTRKPHPLAARIKRLMQADDGVGKIAQGTPLAISKAVELLLLEISYGGIRLAQREGVRTVSVRHLGQVQQTAPEFGFIQCLKAVKFELDDKGGAKIKNEPKLKRKIASEDHKNGKKLDQGQRQKEVKGSVNKGNKRKKQKKEKEPAKSKKTSDEPIVLDEEDDIVFINAIYNQNNNSSNNQKSSTQYNNFAQTSKQQQQQQQKQLQNLQQQQQQQEQEQDQIQLQKQFSYKQYNINNGFQQQQQQQLQQQQIAPCFQQLQTISGISNLGQSGGLYDDEDDYDNL